MKTLFLVVCLALFTVACSGTGNSNKSAENRVSTNTSPPPPAAEKTNSTSTTSELATLKDSVGKTATEINLWQHKVVGPRLEKLLGSDYAAMKKNWNTESLLRVEGNVLTVSGCQQHNCGANQYIIFADTANDNINVVHLFNGKMKRYNEKDEILLPKAMADDFAALKKDAGVK